MADEIQSSAKSRIKCNNHNSSTMNARLLTTQGRLPVYHTDSSERNDDFSVWRSSTAANMSLVLLNYHRQRSVHEYKRSPSHSRLHCEYDNQDSWTDAQPGSAGVAECQLDLHAVCASRPLGME